MEAPKLEFTFEARMDVGAPSAGGVTQDGRRHIVPILGGTVFGPKLNALVLPGGADWQVVRPDGFTSLVGRFALRTADGTLITVVKRGVHLGAPESADGPTDDVDPDMVHFRCTASFEAAEDSPHAWLNRHVLVATGERHRDQMVARFWKVG